MKRIRNKKGFTLVELLAVIVVLAIVMGIAAVGITSVLNNTRKKSFATNAELFIDGARDLVNASYMNGLLNTSASNYAPKCDSTNTPIYIPVLAVDLESGGKTSPYNNDYIKGTSKTASATVLGNDADGKAISYVKVTPTFDSTIGVCTYAYEIFLSDGVYAVAKKVDSSFTSIPESEINADSVIVLQ